jgi:hypothetical protein
MGYYQSQVFKVLDVNGYETSEGRFVQLHGTGSQEGKEYQVPKFLFDNAFQAVATPMGESAAPVSEEGTSSQSDTADTSAQPAEAPAAAEGLTATEE